MSSEMQLVVMFIVRLFVCLSIDFWQKPAEG